ncbi:MAG: hypothetical protein ACI32E_00170 [Bacilli bacterium]
MKRMGEAKYYVRTSNSHLLNILDSNYYIELGVIDIPVLNKLLKYQVLDINQIIDLELLNTGIGKITDDDQTDAYYQLNYLISLRQKSSSSKFFLTFGTLTYLDDFGCEKFAPIVLIPLEIDYQSNKITMSNAAIPNRHFIKLLARKFRDTNEDQNRFLDYYMNFPLNTSYQFDRLMLDLVNETKYQYSPTSFLTVCDVEYQDFALRNDYFNIERSIYETTNTQIMQQYFDNIYSVLPTNIDQKYAILKVSQGENLAIDGRLGTGKTYTIINILADAIRKDKKVLYVNQDLDNIWDVEKNLKFLGLGQYIYNLTKNLRDIDVPQMSLPQLHNVTLAPEEINMLIEYENVFDERINGETIAKILEDYATIKNSNIELKPVVVETDLQKHEINNLYNCLKKVEKSFDVIENYSNNIWRKLNISHNNYIVSEIIERTNRLYEVQQKLNKEVESFCKKYQLCFPSSFSDLYRLISHINSFGVIKPIALWQSSEIRQSVKSALMEIQDLSDQNYNVTKYYDKYIDDNYEPGYAKIILKELCGKDIKIKNVSETDNNEFIDNLLSSNAKLQTLVNQIRLNNEKIKECEKKIDEIFNTKNLHKLINKEYYNFFIKFQYYSSNYFTLSIWVNSLLANPKLFFSNGKKVQDIYISAQKEREEFGRYLINYNSLSYSEISELIRNRRFVQIIKRYFDQKMIKNNHAYMMDIIQKVKNYYELIRQAMAIISDPDYNDNKTAEEIIRNYLGLYEFTLGLNKEQLNLIDSALIKYSDSTTINLEPFNEILSHYISECEKADHLAELMKQYNININGDYGFEKYHHIYSYVVYLERVIDLRKEVSQIFKGNHRTSSKELFELIHNDDLYLEVKKIMNDNDQNYRMLLGENYRGFDTVINEVGQTIDHFDGFMARLNPDADVNSLFQEPTFSRFCDNAIKINNLISDWIQSNKAFSICFKGGTGALQTNGLKENVAFLKKYVQTESQIEHILYINEVLQNCHMLGLESIANLIVNAKPKDCLAESFLNGVLKKEYEYICSKYPIVLDFTPIKEKIEKLYLQEIDYCTKNIISLQKNEEKRNKSRLTNVRFDDYNRIIESILRYVNIYLADVNIFNSNLDLSVFDLVIIDDGHLSSANKYNRLNECRQCVVFGDKSFQSSYVNTLMKRINNSSIITYRNRYIKMSPHFNNTWNTNNRYIYSYDTKIVKQMVLSIEQFATRVVELFTKNQRHIINVIVGTEQTRRSVYTEIVNLLKNYYANTDIMDILCYNIRIINAVNEGSRYVNDVVIYYNDFIELEQNKKELIFKNFVVVSSGIYIYYIGSKSEENNNEILKNINNTIGKLTFKPKYLDGVSPLLYNRLKNEGVSLKEGFGRFDIIINDKKLVGVMIIGKASGSQYSLIDDYQYFYHEYTKNGWDIEIIPITTLINNFDEVVAHLVKVARGEANDSK